MLLPTTTASNFFGESLNTGIIIVKKNWQCLAQALSLTHFMSFSLSILWLEKRKVLEMKAARRNPFFTEKNIASRQKNITYNFSKKIFKQRKNIQSK